jgi:hypothetical protein
VTEAVEAMNSVSGPGSVAFRDPATRVPQFTNAAILDPLLIEPPLQTPKRACASP